MISILRRFFNWILPLNCSFKTYAMHTNYDGSRDIYKHYRRKQWFGRRIRLTHAVTKSVERNQE